MHLIRLSLFSIFCFSCTSLFAQVPKHGVDSLLDIGCWNIEWFGDASNGPTNEQLQYNNVKTVLNNTDIDVWGLCEVSSNTDYMNLINDLQKYNEVMAAYSQTQKTALIWKKDMFDLVSWQMILNTSQYNYDFAGRPPLEVILKTKNATVVDTFCFYVIHLKAFADQDSYNRRKNASGHLKTYLDANKAGKKVVVIGDWNDDVLYPIWSGATESPFVNFVNDSLNYFYPSKRLSELGKKSYASSSGTMIDHHLISNETFPFYVTNSSKVLDDLPTQISGYVSNTSDHYPVISYYNLQRTDTSVTALNELAHDFQADIFPNPASKNVHIRLGVRAETIFLSDMSGRKFYTIWKQTGQGEYILELPYGLDSGIYMLMIEADNKAARTWKLQVIRD